MVKLGTNPVFSANAEKLLHVVLILSLCTLLHACIPEDSQVSRMYIYYLLMTDIHYVIFHLLADLVDTS